MPNPDCQMAIQSSSEELSQPVSQCPINPASLLARQGRQRSARKLRNRGRMRDAKCAIDEIVIERAAKGEKYSPTLMYSEH